MCKSIVDRVVGKSNRHCKDVHQTNIFNTKRIEIRMDKKTITTTKYYNVYLIDVLFLSIRFRLARSNSSLFLRHEYNTFSHNKLFKLTIYM